MQLQFINDQYYLIVEKDCGSGGTLVENNVCRCKSGYRGLTTCDEGK